MRRLETSRLAWAAFLALALLLLCIEGTWPFAEGSAPRVAAAWSWIGFSVLVLCWALALVVLPFLRPGFWKSRDLPWFLAAHVIPVGLVLFEVNGWKFTQINGEGAQEVQSGYFFLTRYPDLGIFKMGFLGYPTRQYLLAALPSYILGKGLVTLRMGYGTLYVLGYLSFLQATWRYMGSRNSPRPMLLASLTGTLVSLGSYPLLHARIFEQTIEPLSVTFLFLAGLLLLLSRPGPLPALWAAWALGLLPYSYTPAYAPWLFAMALLVCLALSRSAGQRLPIAVILACGAASFATSVAMLVHEHSLAGKVALGGFDGLVARDWLFRLSGGFHATIGLEESLVPAPLLLGLVFILVHSLGRRDFRVLWVCAWGAGTVAVALALKGYCWRLPEFDVHRAMTILPVLSLALGLYLSENWSRLSQGADERLLRGLVISAMVVMILNSACLPFLRRTPRGSDPTITGDDEEAIMLVLHVAGRSPRTIYMQPPLDCDLDDILRYFWPDTAIVRSDPPEGEHLPGVYVLSFLNKDPMTRVYDFLVWHANRRPYLQLRPE
jgi:hypothetical protein